MYRVVAMMAGAEGKRTAQFDRLLDALFCALTWSLGEGADVTLADASVLVCTITDGDLRVNDETVEVEAVLARAAQIRLAA